MVKISDFKARGLDSIEPRRELGKSIVSSEGICVNINFILQFYFSLQKKKETVFYQ